jgi:small subunit ribosomal protein S8
MQDTLSDMLVRIKNAQSANKKEVVVVASRLNSRICDLLTDEGFIQGYVPSTIENKPFLTVSLKYYGGNKPVIQNIKRKSKSSLRVYIKSRDIPNIVDGFGVMVLSTPKGVKSHLQAKKDNVGGEVLFLIN